MSRLTVRWVAAAVAALVGAGALAEPPATPKVPAASAAAEAGPSATKPLPRIYGSQMMTEQERADYRAKMHALKTPEERAEFRRQHHELMQARAKERGIAMPDGPMRGSGMGPGRMGKGLMHQGNPPAPPAPPEK